MKSVLVVDDDILLCQSVAFNLRQAGYEAVILGSAEDALSWLQTHIPDLVLLDIGLPGMDGLEAVRVFRNQTNAPVIFVTAHRRELDEIIGLEVGADDYITKPFDFDVLLAHIKAVLRRSSLAPQLETALEVVQVGDLTINPPAHSVKVGKREVELSPKEFDLLLTLAREANRVLSMETLLGRVWGPDWIGEAQTIYVHIRWLREKIEKDPMHPHRLLTIKGVGYKLVPMTE